MIHAYQLVVVLPYAAALLLVAIPGYRIGAVINVLASAATLAVGLWLVVADRTVGDYAIVDEFNVVFIVINTLSASRRRCSAPRTSATRSRSAGCRRASCASTTPCSRR